MRSLLFILLFTGILSGSYAQSISGTVSAGQQSFAGATVSLLKAKDSSLLLTAISDVQGQFTFTYTPQDSLLLRVSATGYTTVYAPALTGIINPVILSPADHVLKNVSVTATRPLIEIKPDKIVFNVEHSITAAGSSVLELLRKSPGVLVDNNETITLAGSGVAVYIDNRPTYLSGKELADYLRTIQSADIATIELIKNPSAKYDAAGTGGIINIRLKRNKSYGLNGTANAGYGIGVFGKYNAGLNLNYRNKKLNVFTSYGVSGGVNKSFINLYREQNDSIFDQKSTTVSHTTSHTARLGTDYFINAKHTIGVLATLSTTDWSDKTAGRTPIAAISNKMVTRILQANNSSTGDRTNASFNFNHHYTGAKGLQWNTDLDYGIFSVNQQALQPNRYVTPDGMTVLEEKNYKINTTRRINLLTFKSDYEQDYKGGRLGTGIKMSQVATTNDFLFFNRSNTSETIDKDRSNVFTLKEAIYAAYINYQRAMGKKWNTQFGIRVEHTATDGLLESVIAAQDKEVKRSYTDLFPSLGISYTANASNTINLNYSRRINRPGYQSLNPFETKLDELTYQKGNPFLKPEYTNSISLAHSYKYKLNSSLSYSRTTDFSAQITDTIEGKRNFIQQKNAGTQETVNVNISYPFTVTKYWNIFSSIGATRMINHVNLDNEKKSRLAVNSFNLYVQQTISLPNIFTLELSGFYNSPTIWGGTFRNQSFWGIDAGIQRRFLQTKAAVKLSVTDIFNSMQWHGISNFGGLYMDAGGGWESRQLKLNFSYRFGRKEIKSQRQRSTGNEDINQRL